MCTCAQRTTPNMSETPSSCKRESKYWETFIIVVWIKVVCVCCARSVVVVCELQQDEKKIGVEGKRVSRNLHELAVFFLGNRWSCPHDVCSNTRCWTTSPRWVSTLILTNNWEEAELVVALADAFSALLEGVVSVRGREERTEREGERVRPR